jgi:hypothetical protein
MTTLDIRPVVDNKQEIFVMVNVDPAANINGVEVGLTNNDIPLEFFNHIAKFTVSNF